MQLSAVSDELMTEFILHSAVRMSVNEHLTDQGSRANQWWRQNSFTAGAQPGHYIISNGAHAIYRSIIMTNTLDGSPVNALQLK